MNIKKFTTSLIILWTFTNNSWAGFISGNELHSWQLEKENPNGSKFNSGLFSGYVSGVVDMGDNILFCTSAGVTAGQYGAIVAKYINNNPEKWNINAHYLVVSALEEAFPCKK